MTFTPEHIAQEIDKAKVAYPAFTIRLSDDDGTPKITVSVDHPALADREIIYVGHLTSRGWLMNTQWNRGSQRYEKSFKLPPSGWTVLHAPGREEFAEAHPHEVLTSIKKIAAQVAKHEYLERRAYA